MGGTSDPVHLDPNRPKTYPIQTASCGVVKVGTETPRPRTTPGFAHALPQDPSPW